MRCKGTHFFLYVQIYMQLFFVGLLRFYKLKLLVNGDNQEVKSVNLFCLFPKKSLRCPKISLRKEI